MSADSHLYPRKDELALLGACLLGGIDTSADVLAQVPVSAIFADDIRESYALVARLTQDGAPCDVLAVEREWRKANGQRPAPMALWMEAQDACPSPANAPYFASGVLDGWRRRRVMETGSLLASRAKEGHSTVDELLAEAEQVLTGHESHAVEIMDGRAAAKACIDDLSARHQRQGRIGGVETGFEGLDRMCDGLQSGEQAIIAARPSIGKTAAALAVLEHACIRSKVPTLFLTLEMSPGSLLRRMASSWGRIPMNDLRRGTLSENHFKALAAYNRTCAEAPLYIVDGVGGMTISDVVAVIRRAKRKHGVQLVILDYLQKVEPSTKHEKRTYEVAEVSKRLKGVAAKTGVALLTLAQLNRESEKDKRPPRLSDLADSGQIERDGDMIALLHRDRGGENAHDAMLIIAKQRDGETGTVKLHFDGKYCRFTCASRIE